MRSPHWNWMDITFLGVMGAMICLDYVLKKRLERRPKPPSYPPHPMMTELRELYDTSDWMPKRSKPFPTMPDSGYIPVISTPSEEKT